LIRINVYAADYGWLFEDLKRHFAGLDRTSGFGVSVSAAPLREADAWVALRSREAAASPDPKRTVACLHDLAGGARHYGDEGDRRDVRGVGGIVFSHPAQRRILLDAGIELGGKATVERPLGALKIFTRRNSLPEIFSVGWVGRNLARKRIQWFVQAMRELQTAVAEVRAVLIGELLEEVAGELRAGGVECRLYPRTSYTIEQYPELYHALDCVVITGTSEAGPLPLFEALATGLPVVSTPVGWAPRLSKELPRYVRLADGPREITSHLCQVRAERESLFETCSEAVQLAGRWTLDGWMLEVLGLAASLASEHPTERLQA
jgi:glycosyltransferase involved in cell wall biosynthesis